MISMETSEMSGGGGGGGGGGRCIGNVHNTKNNIVNT